MMSIIRSLVLGIVLLGLFTVAQASRDDVLIIVNDNSVDSPQVGAYYAHQRDIDPANIVRVKVPNSYFINWDDFRRLRDQIIHFMQANTLSDPTLTPVVCTDGEPPHYCQAAMDQLRAQTRIRYLVTTRGVPTRMTVDGSPLHWPVAPTSVDNYLKYWLINYFTDDIPLKFTERETAFGDGSGMRLVKPAIDRELIVGRIDGLDLNSARALVDRSVAAERAGIYGTWFGSTKFFKWRDEATGTTIYPKSGSSLLGWRYALGLWDEDRPECTDYLDFSGILPEGKAPAHCRVQLNDNSNPSIRPGTRSYPAPGNVASRQPLAVNAQGYQGWLDGQRAVGSFDAVLNWRKNDQCTVTLCDNADDPEACRDNSSDVFAELNSNCVGVADGFIGYNHQSWPVSYLAVWPTGWQGPGSGDVDQLAFPEVRTDKGSGDKFSLWFRNTDQVDKPRCYASSDFSQEPNRSCVDARRLVLTQTIPLADTPFDASNPPAYRVRFRYQYKDFTRPVNLNMKFLVHETGTAGNVRVDYGTRTMAILDEEEEDDWQTARVTIRLDPALHTASSYDSITISFETSAAFTGELGIDRVSVKKTGDQAELAINGSFAEGHRQVSSGDHAATFLNRLSGTAFWGSVSHHQSAGCAFCFNGLQMHAYFMRGLPLGDAVWFNESNNSGILYGDPLYSPAAVRLNPIQVTDTPSGLVELYGSTVNGRNPAEVTTTYRVDVCPGDDFFVCNLTPLSWQATGISGQGGRENALLGTLDTTAMASGDHTLRLSVTSIHTESGQSRVINDFQSFNIPVPPDADSDGIADASDNCLLVVNPDQRDTDADGFGNFCDTDLDNDGVTGLSDYTLFTLVYFTDVPNVEPYTLADHADFNNDAAVNLSDFSVLRGSFGKVPGPSCCGVVAP